MDPLDIQIPYHTKKSAYNLSDNLFIHEKKVTMQFHPETVNKIPTEINQSIAAQNRVRDNFPVPHRLFNNLISKWCPNKMSVTKK